MSSGQGEGIITLSKMNRDQHIEFVGRSLGFVFKSESLSHALAN